MSTQQLVTAMHHTLHEQSTHKPRVLHVEDDKDLTRIIATLGQNVANFDLAATLADARVKLNKNRYDVVLIDIGMPDGSGWELLPIIKSLDPRPAIIVLSGQELSAAEKQTVQLALLKSHTSTEAVLASLKQLLASG